MHPCFSLGRSIDCPQFPVQCTRYRHFPSVLKKHPLRKFTMTHPNAGIANGYGSHKRTLNFSSGPAKIPDEVLLIAQKELLNYHGLGYGVMEMSHRSKEFVDIVDGAEKSVRDLLHVPDNYKVIFLPGGVTGQFSSIPLNLMRTGRADYLVTGQWSKVAAKEAEKYGDVSMVVPLQDQFTTIPDQSTWALNDDASYLYYCENETIHSLEFPTIPDVPGNVLLVNDATSSIMSRNLDVSKFGVLFAGAQKNMGCAGITMVIVRDDLIGYARKECPSILDYALQSKANSLHNTPPCYNIYIMALCLQWTQKYGGVNAMEDQCRIKSNLLYDVVDRSNSFYNSPVDWRYRSRINPIFFIGSGEAQDKLQTNFLAEAKKLGIVNIRGHSLIGGMRPSLYNATTVEDTQVLVDFMKDFQDRYSDKI